MPSSSCQPPRQGHPRKLARPFKGPYRVVALYPNGTDLHLIRKPRSELIRVHLNRLRRCPTEVAGDHAPELDNLTTISMDSSPGQTTMQDTRVLEDATDDKEEDTNWSEPPPVWSIRLRPRKNCSRANSAETGEM